MVRFKRYHYSSSRESKQDSGSLYTEILKRYRNDLSNNLDVQNVPIPVHFKANHRETKAIHRVYNSMHLLLRQVFDQIETNTNQKIRLAFAVRYSVCIWGMSLSKTATYFSSTEARIESLCAIANVYLKKYAADAFKSLMRNEKHMITPRTKKRGVEFCDLVALIYNGLNTEERSRISYLISQCNDKEAINIYHTLEGIVKIKTDYKIDNRITHIDVTSYLINKLETIRDNEQGYAKLKNDKNLKKLTNGESSQARSLLFPN